MSEPDHHAHPADHAADPGGGALTVLGQTVQHPIEHLECFPAPGARDDRAVQHRRGHVDVPGHRPARPLGVGDRVRPDRRCIESKSLKLYLWSFRDRQVFCEALAAEIADEVVQRADPHEVTVTVTQQPRGGIVIEATATRQRGS